MSVVTFKPASEEMQGGVTHAQAMEIGRRFLSTSDAAPTIAHAMEVPYETVCAVLGGRLWPGVRRYWLDRCLP